MVRTLLCTFEPNRSKITSYMMREYEASTSSAEPRKKRTCKVARLEV